MERKDIKEDLEIRKARIEIYKSIDEVRASKVKYQQEEDRRELENEDLRIRTEKTKNNEGGWNTPLGQLLDVSRAWYIDNERTIIGSEPALRSLWDEDELLEIKSLIMKKVREL